ncbi:MAG: hypothetical protein HY556_03915 [Euryarchaeota archaeon]|nr:hypothetical protein [Euryarchaeota archaeon]
MLDLGSSTTRRFLVAAIVSLVSASAFTAFVVAVSPETFFETNTPEGQPVREIRIAGAVSYIIGAAVLSTGFAVSFMFLRKAPRLPLAASILLVFSTQAVAYVGYAGWEYHETPEFCVRTCHVMEPTYLSYADPGQNKVMAGHLKNGTAECLDCHTGPGLEGQVDLMLTSARHVWKYAVAGGYDPGNLGGADAVKKVPDANCLKCHAEASTAKLPEKHDNFETKCALCHDPHKTNSSGYFYPDIILEKDDCSLCHRSEPVDFVKFPSKHSDLAADDCRNCHKTHGNATRDPGATLSCTDSGCHDQNASNKASLVSLKHANFADEAQCASCHGTAHNLTKVAFAELAKDCTVCHAGKKVAAGNAHLEKKVLNATDCTGCHGEGAPDAKAERTLGAHGELKCQSCHKAGNDKGAPVMAFAPTSQSEISWQRQNDKNFANWTQSGRGSHDGNLKCSDCHRLHKEPYPLFPENKTCDSGCHKWLGNITQAGFPNANPTIQGSTTYRGSIDPALLLNYSKDMNGNGRDHKAIFEKFGCTSFCHNPAVTLEIAESWAASGADLPKNVTPSETHGNITQCTNCHRFKSPGGGASDLHSTHIPFIQAEQKAADTRGVVKEACDYCHSAGPYPDAEAGGCYNCHLSGHRPETYYWGAAPEG